ncbi:6824_t:CDS:2, partial [Entrophospora sp. SA101]
NYPERNLTEFGKVVFNDEFTPENELEEKNAILEKENAELEKTNQEG